MTKTLVITIAAMLFVAVRAQGEEVTFTKETEALWNKNCAQCHGKDGKGKTRMGRKVGVKDYTDPEVVAKFKDPKQQFKWIKEGMEQDGKTLMKPFKEKLKDKEIEELVKFSRHFVKKDQ